MKYSDIKTADGVRFVDIDGGVVYCATLAGVRFGMVFRLECNVHPDGLQPPYISVTWTHGGKMDHTVFGDIYAVRANAYARHIEIVQADANAKIAAAIKAVSGGAA